MSNLVCIRTFLSEPEADIAQGVLKSNGIEAIISADDCAGWRSHLSFLTGGIRLLVKEEDVQIAKEILKGD